MGAAIAHEHGIAQTGIEGQRGRQHMRDEAGPAHHRAVDELGMDAQVLGYGQHPHRGVDAGGSDTVDVAHVESRIVHGVVRGFGQYFQLAASMRFAEPSMADADDCDRTSQISAHWVSPTGVNTTKGWS